MQVQVSDNKKLQRIYKGLENHSGEEPVLMAIDIPMNMTIIKIPTNIGRR